MLKKINEGGVEGYDFTIQITGLETLVYTSGDNSTELNLAYDAAKRKVYVYATEIDTLDEIAKNKMIADIKAAVKLLRDDFEII